MGPAASRVVRFDPTKMDSPTKFGNLNESSMTQGHFENSKTGSRISREGYAGGMHRDATDSTIVVNHTGRGNEKSRKMKSD